MKRTGVIEACASELDDLLAEAPSEAAERMRAVGHAINGGPCVLYGAGELGLTVLHKLRAIGIEPVSFADDTPEKQGRIIEGLPVMTPQAAAARFGANAVFIVTILNPRLNFVTARARIEQLTENRVFSFLHMAWRHPGEFLPYYQFEPPELMLSKQRDIRDAFDLFEDEESRQQFIAHVRFRLHLDHAELPPADHGNYFPTDIGMRLSDRVVFVDCGAFDGDTIRLFLAQQGEGFGAIYAFEPDKRNFDKLSSYVEGLAGNIVQKIHLFNAGVGEERSKLRFNSAGNMSSSVNNSGDAEIDIFPIQDVVRADGGPVYLKFDVEGAESEALAGCEKFFKDSQTMFAISVYHRPDDLWQLPLYVASKTKDYRFYLRTQGEDGMDVICYALPPGD
ncbi:MAG TPA: FkbM family methyltransferase [Pyrinomonadaceae bacterium]|jgi:FkbM family methyltransferase|nr:FkbM family methyltransferase [Pyrinomonadaceae bacterium]